MARTIFIYGVVAGVLTLMLLGLGMGVVGVDRGPEGMIWGYGAMVFGLSVMFMGVRRYSMNYGDLTFAQAFSVAFGIFAVAGLVYTLGWEAYLAATNYTFADQFASQTIASKVAEGASPAELKQVQAQMTAFKSQYANPLLRILMTFMETVPVGLVMSLLAGATLRARRDDDRVAA